jgi:hypothetical protein
MTLAATVCTAAASSVMAPSPTATDARNGMPETTERMSAPSDRPSSCRRPWSARASSISSKAGATCARYS